MIPLTFCLENCLELLSHKEREQLSKTAKDDIQKLECNPPSVPTGLNAYEWEFVVKEHKRVWYMKEWNREASKANISYGKRAEIRDTWDKEYFKFIGEL